MENEWIFWLVFTSSSATNPFLSNFTSSSRGCSDPFFSLPNPSPGFQPIFCNKCIPIPPETGVVAINWSCFHSNYEIEENIKEKHINFVGSQMKIYNFFFTFISTHTKWNWIFFLMVYKMYVCLLYIHLYLLPLPSQ